MIKTRIIISLMTCFSLILSCNVSKKTHQQISTESYEYTYRVWPYGDTIFVATLENDMLNGPIKCIKKQGNYIGGIYDITYRDAFNNNRWTYGYYKNNLKNGEWYSLNENGKKIKSINYKNDTLNGQFISLLFSGSDTIISCNYLDGRLDGEFLFNQGNGRVNGESLWGEHKWKLNYKHGKLDGIQRKFYKGELEEEMKFENGRLIGINISKYVSSYNLDENGTGSIEVHRASFVFGILGKQFDAHYNDLVSVKIFGDDIYSGTIEMCHGIMCPGELRLFSEISKTLKVFSVNYIPEIIRKN